MMTKYKCFECGSEEDIHHHHVVPKSLGGTKMVPLCFKCHGLVHGGISYTRLNRESVTKRKAQGLAVSKPPYGFKIGEGKKLEPNPSELEVIGVMKTLRYGPSGRYGDSKTPWRAVADHLNAHNLLKRNGKIWTEHNVYKCYHTHQRYAHLLEE